MLGVNAKQVATGIYHTCALLNNGSVKCWGDNTSSQLGDGTTADRLQPVDVQRLSGVKEISARSGFHTCVLMESGAVKCWGFNGFGQLGDGSFTQRSSPTDVIGLSSGVVSVSAGGYHTCALLSSGTVKCWGKNQLGELANGNNSNATKPTSVVGIGAAVRAISAGGYGASPDIDDSCVLLDKGAVKCWGYSLNDF
jgi:alpha-tubulin suppressor-like RCC1 family protein